MLNFLPSYGILLILFDEHILLFLLLLDLKTILRFIDKWYLSILQSEIMEFLEALNSLYFTNTEILGA